MHFLVLLLIPLLASRAILASDVKKRTLERLETIDQWDYEVCSGALWAKRRSGEFSDHGYQVSKFSLDYRFEKTDAGRLKLLRDFVDAFEANGYFDTHDKKPVFIYGPDVPTFSLHNGDLSYSLEFRYRPRKIRLLLNRWWIDAVKAYANRPEIFEAVHELEIDVAGTTGPLTQARSLIESSPAHKITSIRIPGLGLHNRLPGSRGIFSLFREVRSLMPQLRGLNMWGTGISDEDFSTLIEDRFFQGIEYLNLGATPELSFDMIFRLATSGQLENLRDLTIDITNLSDEQVIQLLGSLPHLKILRAIGFRDLPTTVIDVLAQSSLEAFEVTAVLTPEDKSARYSDFNIEGIHGRSRHPFGTPHIDFEFIRKPVSMNHP